MSAFNSNTLVPTILNPKKRVCYSTGLVMGVDEFMQEQTFFMERDNRHNRLLHGYGTVSGLQVSIREESETPEILVSPGVAIDPCGRTICVDIEQCARLNAWLTNHAEEVLDQIPAVPGPLSLYIVLCYRECKSDLIPVPGGPCRSQEDAQTASRITEDFELRLSFDPPEQVAIEAYQAFSQFLGSVEIQDVAPLTTPDEMADLVRGMVVVDGTLPDPDITIPAGPVNVHPDDADAALRAAFGVWISEIKPILLGGSGCAPAEDAEKCVLLAQVDMDIVDVDGTPQIDPAGAPGFSIEQSQRPYLVSSRLMQGLTGVSGDTSFFNAPAPAAPPGPGPVLGGNFIRAAAGSYGVVAAGRFDAGGNAEGPTYNNLVAVGLAQPGEFRLRFDDYANPDDEDFNYMVKGTPIHNTGTGARAVFEVVRFQNNGIRIRLRDVDNNAVAAGFMIEISAFGGFPA